MEAEKRTNYGAKIRRFSNLPSSSFVLEPDYVNIAKRLQPISQPFNAGQHEKYAVL